MKLLFFSSESAFLSLLTHSWGGAAFCLLRIVGIFVFLGFALPAMPLLKQHLACFRGALPGRSAADRGGNGTTRAIHGAIPVTKECANILQTFFLSKISLNIFLKMFRQPIFKPLSFLKDRLKI